MPDVRRRSVALLAVTGALVAGCGDDGDSTGSENASSGAYRVLVLSAQSGPAGPVGVAEEQAVKAAADRFNKDGGIDGREIVVESADTGGVATNAVSHLQKALASSSKPDLVWAGTSSDETLALCPVLGRAKILSVSITSDEKVGDPGICPYNFSTSLSAEGNMELMSQYMKERGWKRVALLTDSGAYGTAMLEGAKRQLPNVGLEVVAEEQFAGDALDVTAQWKKLKSSNADVVMVEVQGAAGGPALNGRAKVGWDVDVVAGPGLAGSNPAKLVSSPSVLDGVTLYTASGAVEGKVAEPERLDEALPYLIKYNGDEWPIARNVPVATWDTIAIVQTAAKQAQSTDADALREALEGFEANPPADATWIGRKNYAFSPERHFSTPSDYDPAKPEALSAEGTFPPAS